MAGPFSSFPLIVSPLFGFANGIEVGFTGGAGSLAPGANTGEIQNRFNKTDWSNYDETDDYSYHGSLTAFTLWTKVTICYKGAPVWGTEP